MIDLVDTFPDFLELWFEQVATSVDSIKELWLTYMHPYPHLLQKQIQCYQKDGIDWSQLAKERVFPLYTVNLGRMQTAHDSVKRSHRVLLQLNEEYRILPQPSLVIYVGIGCGAGWATTYDGRPAILTGLEKIAECNWQEPHLVTSLLAHEYGHLYQSNRRLHISEKDVKPQTMTLFREGFAQWFDHLVSGSESWSLCVRLNDATWPAWCAENSRLLASEYLEIIETNRPANAFFGDWLEVHGRKQVGYYLGHAFVESLRQRISMVQIAELVDVEGEVCQFLQKCSRGKT